MACAFVSAVYGDSIAKDISNLIEHTPNTNSTFDPFAAHYDLPPPPAFSSSTLSTAPITQFGVLAFPGFVGFDAISVLAFVESVVEFTDIPLNISLIVPGPGSVLAPVWTAGYTMDDTLGQSYLPTHTIANPPSNLEVLIVPGLPTATSFPHQDELVAFLKTIYPSLQHIISVGTGSALLAAAGILDARSATTSKTLFDPWPITKLTSAGGSGHNVAWTTGRWVRDGNVWTASGAASGLDAAHALFAEIYGEALAGRAAEVLEYQPRAVPSEDPFAL